MEKITKFLSELKGKTVHVIGFSGMESAEMALFLAQEKKISLHLHDFSDKESIKKHFRLSHSGLSNEERELKLEKILALPAQFHFRNEYLAEVKDADFIFVPQSWYLYDQNESLKKFEATKRFMNLTCLYFKLFPGKILAVTGSNGKTTTSNLIAHIFETAENHKKLKGKFYFTGNDRRTSQMLTEISDASKDDWLILEVSNRQLRIDLGKSPEIGVITNITPNHLHEYNSWEDYKSAKESLLRYTAPEKKTAVLNYDDPESLEVMERALCEVFGFSTKKELNIGAYVSNGTVTIRHGNDTEKICDTKDLLIKGEHNVSNVLAAAGATFLAGIEPKIIREAVTSFIGVPQRMELIAQINDRDIYNDTAATTPVSTRAAIGSLGGKNILIMGGKSKGVDYGELLKDMSKHIETLILIKSSLSDELNESGLLSELKAITVNTLEEAVKQAWENSKKGQSIIFSPGAEYFSYFQDIMPGYKNFRTYVERLKTYDS
jgi:UDP-N-acetylmuramoylalanine--D-glutamate ligase